MLSCLIGYVITHSPTKQRKPSSDGQTTLPDTSVLSGSYSLLTGGEGEGEATEEGAVSGEEEYESRDEAHGSREGMVEDEKVSLAV